MWLCLFRLWSDCLWPPSYTAAFKQWPCCMLHHKWEGVQMTQQREEREKTNHPKQLSCTVQPQGEGWEGAQEHLVQAQS